MKVSLFTCGESRELLRGRGIGTDADELAEALGDLPAALDQVGSWLSRTGTSVVECLGLLAGDATELLRARYSSAYEVPVEAMWNVPLRRLKDDNQRALTLLWLCAFVAPTHIPHALITEADQKYEAGSEERKPFETIRSRNAVQALAQRSLVEVDYQDHSLALHPLLQLVVRGQMGAGDDPPDREPDALATRRG